VFLSSTMGPGLKINKDEIAVHWTEKNLRTL
jgi:hypothetical protein